MSDISNALRTPRDMDEYLELRTSAQIISDFKRELALNSFGTVPVSPDENEAISLLVEACGGVPYLATCIYETLKRSNLTIVRMPAGKKEPVNVR